MSFTEMSGLDIDKQVVSNSLWLARGLPRWKPKQGENVSGV